MTATLRKALKQDRVECLFRSRECVRREKPEKKKKRALTQTPLLFSSLLNLNLSPPSAEQESAGFLAGLEVASIVGGVGAAGSGRPSRTASFANLSSSLSSSAAVTPRSSPPPPRPLPQQLPPSSLGVSPPLRPSVPLPQTVSGSLVSSPTFASSMQKLNSHQQSQQQQQQSRHKQQQQQRCSSASAALRRGGSASSSQRQGQQA